MNHLVFVKSKIINGMNKRKTFFFIYFLFCKSAKILNKYETAKK